MKLTEAEFEQMQSRRKEKMFLMAVEAEIKEINLMQVRGRMLPKYVNVSPTGAQIEQGYSFVFPYPPSVNEIYKPVPTRKGTMTLRLSAKGKEFKERIGWEAKKQGALLLTGNLCVTYRLYRPQKSGDLENRLKAMADALQGIAYKDDKQIVEIHAYRFDDKSNPRIEVDLREV